MLTEKQARALFEAGWRQSGEGFNAEYGADGVVSRGRLEAAFKDAYARIQGDHLGMRRASTASRLCPSDGQPCGDHCMYCDAR